MSLNPSNSLPELGYFDRYVRQQEVATMRKNDYMSKLSTRRAAILAQNDEIRSRLVNRTYSITPLGNHFNSAM